MINSELETLIQRLDNLREQICGLLAGLPSEALNWRPIEGQDEHATNSLAALGTHIAGAEHFWIAEVIGSYPSTRNREAEFAARVHEPAALCQLLEQAGAETRSILSNLQPADLEGTREVNGRTVSVRWAIIHVIDHTALHLGHMQLTVQLWMGGRSAPSPLWHERLPAGKPDSKKD